MMIIPSIEVAVRQNGMAIAFAAPELKAEQARAKRCKKGLGFRGLGV